LGVRLKGTALYHGAGASKDMYVRFFTALSEGYCPSAEDRFWGPPPPRGVVAEVVAADAS
jgi:hypothetical protein